MIAKIARSTAMIILWLNPSVIAEVNTYPTVSMVASPKDPASVITTTVEGESVEWSTETKNAMPNLTNSSHREATKKEEKKSRINSHTVYDTSFSRFFSTTSSNNVLAASSTPTIGRTLIIPTEQPVSGGS